MMNAPDTETRRRRELLAELRARAKVWLPEWQTRDAPGDFLSALFDIAAGFSSEVTQRLNRVPEKNFRGFLQWLGVRGNPAQAARIPAVFTMSPGAAPVEALPPVQFQALDPDSNPPVMFETIEPFTVTPAKLVSLHGADTRNNRYTSAPPGMLTLAKPGGVPTEWTVIADVAAGERIVQLDPPLGLEPGIVLATDAELPVQYTITKIDGALYTLERALETSLVAGASMKRVILFDPFGAAPDQQQHEVYFGAKTALDLPSKAAIAVDGADTLMGEHFEWHYWGKTAAADSVAGWVKLTAAHGVLLKDAGAVEETPIDTHKNRWLRVSYKQGAPADEPKFLSNVTLRINCDRQAAADAEYEAIANTSPVVKGTEFHPFGREPRLFDTFYVGSKEALSKANALVTLNFTMGDEWASNLGSAAAVNGAHIVHVAAGINVGGALRILRIKATGGADFLTLSQPIDAQGHAVRLDGVAGLGIAASGKWIHFAAVDIDHVCWTWAVSISEKDTLDPDERWLNLGTPPHSPAAVRRPAIYSGPGGLEMVVIADAKIYARPLSGLGDWRALPAKFSGKDVDFTFVGPFVDPTAVVGAEPAAELVAADNSGWIYLFTDAGGWQRVPDKHPPLIPHGHVLATRDDRSIVRVFGMNETKDADSTPTRTLVALLIEPSGNELVVAKVDGLDVAGDRVVPLAAAALARVGFVTRDGRIGNWTAFSDESEPPFYIEVPGSNSRPSLAPARVDRWLVSPATRGHVWITTVDQGAHLSAPMQVDDALILTANLDPTKFIYVIEYRASDGTTRTQRVETFIGLPAARHALVIPFEKKRLKLASPLDFDLYEATALAAHATRDPVVLRVDADLARENGLVRDARVFVSGRARDQLRSIVAVVKEVSAADADTNLCEVTLSENVPRAVSDLAVAVLKGNTRLSSAVLPAVDVKSQAIAEHAAFQFPDLKPSSPRALRALPPSTWVVFAEPWSQGPGDKSNAYVIADATLHDPIEDFESLPRNPHLSWEYWDGSSWWQITDVADTTSHLSMTGTVSFCVPANIAATEVIGHNNFWVRARLTGGDYGQEKVVLETDDDNPKKQTVTRSTEGIRAPFVNKLEVWFELCCPVTPELVLTHDGGGYIDQSAANRSSLTYPVIVPLWRSIDGPDRTRPQGRAVYLGFDAEISGAPISLLLHVEEGNHPDAFPLRVEALFADGFETLVSDDGTRGLNESGTLTLILPRTPLKSTLFGKAQFWIRLRPRQGFEDDEWLPRVVGAWVNGTLAQATETQVEELLGSSDGRPGLVAMLARPPVVAESLRLRVREPLSEEDVDEINEKANTRHDRVRENIGSRPGPWVLWHEVRDLLDAKRGERAFTFDDDTGAITFGDGHRGRIPPIGRDCIIAERYVRGGGAAANRIQAFADANLATPLAGVDGVVLTAAAAGGADAQKAEDVLRFAPDLLRQRGSILTLAELESAARQHSPDIVQALAQSRAGGVDLCIVVRGADPRPSARICRELTRVLSERVAPHLAVRDALTVNPPVAVPVRIKLNIAVDSVDHSGTVIKECARRIHELLNAATGGLDGSGWPLGRWPMEEEIAAMLDGVAHLEGFDTPTVARQDGQARMPRATDIITVSRDDIAITATVAEGVA